MIVFEKVRFKNFGSFGNYITEIDLSKNPTTLVAGNNGHGKSFALLDSITFALFGRPFRKINIPQLVNSINEKDCHVEIEFNANNHDYRIIRGLKPKVFEIYKDGELLDQDAKSKDYQHMLEEQILKMNYKSFTQVVILGSSSFVPFMQLTAADRREVIEDILDIQIFSTMNSLLKTKLSKMKEDIRSTEYGIDLLQEKVKVQEKFIDDVRNNTDKRIERNNKLVEESKDKIDAMNADIESLKNKVEETKKDLSPLDGLSGKIKKFESLRAKMESRQSNIENQLQFFTDNDTCPTCTLTISDEIKSNVISESKEKLQPLEEGLDKIEVDLNELTKELESIRKTEKTIQKLLNEISASQHDVTSTNNYIQKIQNDNQEIINNKETVNTEIENLNTLNDSLLKENETKKELVEEKYYSEIAYSLFKDTGIKSKIIKHYLPTINKLINKYLASMDFFAQFHLDENFSETIKSRHRDEFSYMSFSEGEKMRVDLALLLAWREIARLKNSANTNLLILDEVFDSSLDAFGTEEFLKLLQTLGQSANVYVISHKSDQLIDKFTEYITFEKKGDFSHLKR